MKVMKWSAIALAVSAGSTQFAVADAFVSDQAEAKGFIEDSSLDLLLRNYYFNRDGKSGSGDRVDWTQGFLTTYGNAAQISPLPDYAALSIITRHCHYLSQATR
ncbi:hypothetical protein PA6466_03273 [Pseudomonas aeruginosa]